MQRLSNMVTFFTKKIGNYLFYVFATILSSGLHFIYSMFVKGYIAPGEYGIYSTCLLLQTYLAYLQLGSMNAFNRDYPQLLGAGKTMAAKRFRDTTFTFLISIFSLASVLICILFFLLGNWHPIDNKFLLGFVLCTIITEITVIENFGANRLRAEGKIAFVSAVILAELLSLIVGAYFVSKIGYYGIYITSIVGMLLGIILYSKRAYADIHLGIDTKLLKDILISGLPLLISGLIWTIINSIDKFVIIGFINTEALGLYAVAQNAFSYMVLIPTAISQLFYIKMGRVYGATKDVSVLSLTGVKLSGILALIVSYLCTIAYFLSPLLIVKVMPRYVEGTAAAQILILGLALYTPTMVNSNLLTILRKNAVILRNAVLLCILNAACSILYVVFFGSTLENVAYGTVTAYLCATFILIYQLKKCTDTDIFVLVRYSVLPVFIVIVVDVVFYSIMDNRFFGLLSCLLLISCIYTVIFKNQLLNLLRGKNK